MFSQSQAISANNALWRLDSQLTWPTDYAQSPRDKASDIPSLLYSVCDVVNSSSQLTQRHQYRKFPPRVNLLDEQKQKITSHKCVIETTGDPSAERLLFPEQGIPLFQSDLDASQYEKAIAQLPPAQLKALRTWTTIENDNGYYSDGTLNLAALGQKPINYDLNISLRNELRLTRAEQFIYDNLICALKNDSIPTQRGDFLRTAEYLHGESIPWLAEIKPGDIVTNHPTFMSVSSSDKYAREALLWKTSTADSTRAIIIYRIDDACQPKPLLADAVSTLRYEEEYLYAPDAYFEVKGSSIATSINRQIRIGVTLAERDSPANPVLAKNIFSGSSRRQPGARV